MTMQVTERPYSKTKQLWFVVAIAAMGVLALYLMINRVEQTYDPAATVQTYRLTVVQVDAGADLSAYPGVREGDVISAKLTEGTIWSHQANPYGTTTCHESGLTITTFIDNRTDPLPCGPSIHVAVLALR